jgi:hypothetical protein
MSSYAKHDFIAEHIDVQIPTPDIAARREHLLFAADHTEHVGDVYKENLLKRYAGIGFEAAQPLFAELCDLAITFVAVRDGQPSIGLVGFLPKDEALQMFGQRIEELLAEIVPSACEAQPTRTLTAVRSEVTA